MYAKVFTQIFDSSIAEDYQVRHVFEDLLKLCDAEGVVDMTREAIARRTNMPLEIVNRGIDELMKPDASSRTRDFDGRRIMPISKDRNWGWFIVNYEHYRAIQDEEERRKTYRESKRRQREREKLKREGKVLKNGKPLKGELEHVKKFEAGEVDQDGEVIRKSRGPLD